MRLWQFVDLQHIHTWRSSHVTALKRPALRGAPVSDVYFTFSSTKTRGGDIKEENERDTKESSCTWIIKKKRKHKLDGRGIRHFWQDHPSWSSAHWSGAQHVGTAPAEPPHLGRVGAGCLAQLCFPPAKPLAQVTVLSHNPTVPFSPIPQIFSQKEQILSKAGVKRLGQKGQLGWWWEVSLAEYNTHIEFCIQNWISEDSSLFQSEIS